MVQELVAEEHEQDECREKDEWFAYRLESLPGCAGVQSRLEGDIGNSV
nr:hypothetical protein [Candidatus Sigynarchaeum springense]